jgi:hypothetical protein
MISSNYMAAMSQEEGSEHTPSATPSRSGSLGSGEEQSGSPATRNEASQQDAGPLLPHQLIPAHIKDKEKVDVSASDAAAAENLMVCPQASGHAASVFSFAQLRREILVEIPKHSTWSRQAPWCHHLLKFNNHALLCMHVYLRRGNVQLSITA